MTAAWTVQGRERCDAAEKGAGTASGANGTSKTKRPAGELCLLSKIFFRRWNISRSFCRGIYEGVMRKNFGRENKSSVLFWEIRNFLHNTVGGTTRNPVRGFSQTESRI